jgi:DNA-binding transcriptional LysR family regulator
MDLFRDAGVGLKRVHNISSISAMVQLVEGGFGIATLPLAAVERLSQRLPLKPLKCDATLLPLPIHVSYRDDPGSAVTQGVMEAALDYVKATQPPSKKSMR